MPPAWDRRRAGDVVERMATPPTGLSSAEAAARRRRHGPNEIRTGTSLTRARVLSRQLANPLLLLLLFAAAVSAATGAWIDAAIVAVIVVASTAFGYSREYAAQTAAAGLQRRIATRVSVYRDGAVAQVPTRELVPGDVVLLSTGSLVPADLQLLETRDCLIDESALTGESFPVEKQAAATASDAAEPSAYMAWMGSHVRSGLARGVVIATGRTTRYGRIGERLATARDDTELERALRRFGGLLTTTMLAMVLVVFASNVLLGRRPVDTLLFSLALAVGLSPELLPAILAVNLARGAQALARRGVLVRRLGAIEDLGSIDVLCTDKTGTLTAGVIRVDGAYDADGAPSAVVLALAAQNARLQRGYTNPLDEAIAAACPTGPLGDRVGEVPYDFRRKRVTVAVTEGSRMRLISKGSFATLLGACATVATGDGPRSLDPAARDRLQARHDGWTERGLRVLAVATGERDLRDVDAGVERDLELVGFVTFLDHPKDDAASAVADLAALGVAVKLVSGDSRGVARHVAAAVGIPATRVVTGSDLDGLSPAALARVAEDTHVFAEVDPSDKDRIARALRSAGHVVGFLGDGVNDVPAMHAADTSLSVDQAVDVAREAAELVLLERDLHVIRRGVEEGRRTFANTLKYVMTTTSANLGNMVSMAVASLVLPFLPLLAGQVLLNNLLSDIPAVGMADDRVDPEMIARPCRWRTRDLGAFMLQFGALSSAFDLGTFAVLLLGFGAGPELFRTGWFVESLLTELVIALVVRTRRPLYRSDPGRVLLVSTLVLIPLTAALPFLPHASVLGFVPLPPALLLALFGITATYVAAAELLKQRVGVAR
jgi:Mg2+-importing ATPase